MIHILQNTVLLSRPSAVLVSLLYCLELLLPLSGLAEEARPCSVGAGVRKAHEYVYCVKGDSRFLMDPQDASVDAPEANSAGSSSGNAENSQQVTTENTYRIAFQRKILQVNLPSATPSSTNRSSLSALRIMSPSAIGLATSFTAGSRAIRTSIPPTTPTTPKTPGTTSELAGSSTPDTDAVQRFIHVCDSVTRQEVLTIEVSALGQLKIHEPQVSQALEAPQNPQDSDNDTDSSAANDTEDTTWILDGLASLPLNGLSIQTHGTLVIRDSMELNSQLDLQAESLYLLRNFTIKRGIFRLKYHDGFIAGLNYPFQSKIENQDTVLESVKIVTSPSKRRANLNSLRRVEVDVPTADLESAYLAAYQHRLEVDHPRFLEKQNDPEKREYMRKYILSRIHDNSKKGVIGESIYTSYMQRQFPRLEFQDAKVGLHSFDAVHIPRTSASEAGSSRAPEAHSRDLPIFISEVKYATGGNPQLGIIKLDRQEWRQLSLPYVRNKLEMMEAYLGSGGQIQRLGRMIQAHPPDLVKLRLAVFNPNELKLVIYRVGDLNQSLLD